MATRSLAGVLGFLLMLFVGVSAPAMADTGSDSKMVGNVMIYMGLMPAEIIRGHPHDHSESTMHGGAPAASGEYHVMIALFDEKTGTRITNATATARVYEIGTSVTGAKPLEPMKIAGAETYGNYFAMRGNGPFRIDVTIHIPGQSQEIKAEFEHRHQ